jgi:hypothetical protein
MHPDFPADWARLGKLAFRRHEKIGDVFKRVSGLLESRAAHPDIGCLRIIKDWMLVPFTLWPIDFSGMAFHVCKRIQSGRRLEMDILVCLEHLQELPSAKAQAAISDYELLVQLGNYEPLIRVPSKFSAQEKEILNSPKLRAEWEKLKRNFPIKNIRDRKGIVRRRMAQERNFRTDWEFRRKTVKERFQTAFDAFCHRWHLYGMEGDKPLLLKLSVNPTAHGLMIVIPTYWSLDSKRDLNWRAINKLHTARGALRQGPKMSEGRSERHQQARRAFAAAQEAKTFRLQGQKRWDFIAKKIPVPLGTESRIMRRLIKEGSCL